MRHQIRTAEHVYVERHLAPGVKLDARNEAPADKAFVLYGGDKVRGTAAGKIAKASAVDAYVNEARWIVECPFCASAQVGSPEDPRFLCVECVNAPVDGAYVHVRYPSPSGRAEIEEALAARPHRANVNWVPGETVTELIAQNIENLGVQG
jgi:hypothetical protein